jgi:hypothetical protein
MFLFLLRQSVRPLPTYNGLWFVIAILERNAIATNLGKGFQCYQSWKGLSLLPILERVAIATNLGKGCHCYQSWKGLSLPPILERVVIATNLGKGCHCYQSWKGLSLPQILERVVILPILERVVIATNLGKGSHCHQSWKEKRQNIVFIKRSSKNVFLIEYDQWSETRMLSLLPVGVNL